MSVDRARDLLEAGFQLLRYDELRDQVGRLRADDLCAEQLAVLALAHDLDRPVAVAVDERRADASEREAPDDDVVATVLCLLLGEAEARHLRVAKGRRGNVVVGERVHLQAGGVLDGDDSLIGGLVRERRPVHHVSDRVDAFDGGPHHYVSHDMPRRVEV